MCKTTDPTQRSFVPKQTTFQGSNSPEPQARFMLYDRSLVQSCRRSFVSSSFHVVVLSCSRVVVLSYSRSFVSSCFFPKNSPPILLIPILLLFSKLGFARHCKQPLVKPKATAQPSKPNKPIKCKSMKQFEDMYTNKKHCKSGMFGVIFTRCD